jgi:hypothetical protein
MSISFVLLIVIVTQYVILVETAGGSSGAAIVLCSDNTKAVALHHTKNERMIQDGKTINMGTLASKVMKLLFEKRCHDLPKELLDTDKSAQRWSAEVLFIQLRNRPTFV